jgi:hypothetical protein
MSLFNLRQNTPRCTISTTSAASHRPGKGSPEQSLPRTLPHPQGPGGLRTTRVDDAVWLCRRPSLQHHTNQPTPTVDPSWSLRHQNQLRPPGYGAPPTAPSRQTASHPLPTEPHTNSLGRAVATATAPRQPTPPRPLSRRHRPAASPTDAPRHTRRPDHSRTGVVLPPRRNRSATSHTAPRPLPHGRRSQPPTPRVCSPRTPTLPAGLLTPASQ